MIYSLGPVHRASPWCRSAATLCAADHDPDQPDFPLRERAVRIEDGAWVATDVFVAPGVTVGREAVGARSSVFSRSAARMICHGTPCRPCARGRERAKILIYGINYAPN